MRPALHTAVLVWMLLVAVCAHGALLVTRTGSGLQFTQISSITVQGKDKALSLGSEPKLHGPVGKLHQVPLARLLLRVADANTLAAYEPEGLEYLLPTGLPKDASGDPSKLWQSARVAYKKSPGDKTQVDVPFAGIMAVLPGGFDDLRKICTDSRALELLGGKGRAFAAQLEWLAAAVRAFPAEPALAPLARYVEGSLRERYEAFENGFAGLDGLGQALQFSELSQAAYPNQPEQVRLRKALADRKAWFDRRVAVLKAFSGSEQWDPLLLAGRDLEAYDQAFPELAKYRGEALKQSLQFHRKAGHDRLAEGEYQAAFREYRLASLRQPGDAVLVEEMREAWTEYSRRAAIDRQNKREHLTAGQHDAIERDLYFTEQNRKSGNLDEALKNVSHAESVLSKALREDTFATESLKVLYHKADILGAQGRIGDALAVLDQYDMLAIDDERQPANQLRNQLLFQLDKTLKDLKAQILSVVPEGRYHLVRKLAEQGLRVKEDDPDLLYAAGVASIVTRNQNESLPLLKRYLEVSGMVDGNGERRARVRRLLLSLKNTAPPEQAGEANWLSGKKLPRQVLYCPISLAFQPHIEHIEASNKMRVAFEWDGGRLKSITPSFEKPDQASGEQKLVFGYDRRVPQIASVGNDQPAADPADHDPDMAVRRSAVVLLNNPDVDPVAMKQLTGINLARGIAGNRFFNPFVWEKEYRFQFIYDDRGRVAQAREIDARGTPGNLTVEFEWDGMQLSAVRGYEGPDEKRRALMYERTLQYEGGRLVGEEIQSQGRQGRIKYVYKGDKLVSASCDKGAALDGRSRVVAFAVN